MSKNLDALQNMVHHYAVLKDLATRYSSDGDQKKLIDDNASAIMNQLGADVPKGVSVKLVQDTSKVTHFVMPLSPQGELKDEALKDIAGGGLPAGCASSVGSFPSTIGTGGTLSSNEPEVGIGANDAVNLATGAAEQGYIQGVQDGYAYGQQS